MAYQKSIQDHLSDQLASVARAQINLTNALGGTRGYVLRITEYSSNAQPGRTYDVFGHSEKKLLTPQADILCNIGISYPFNALEIFSSRESGQAYVKAFDPIINDVMPIMMTVSFNDDASQQVLYNQDNQPVTLIRKDIIVDVLRDEFNNKIPVIMRIEDEMGTFWQKNLVQRRFMMTLEFGNLEVNIQQTIDTWVSSLT